MALDLRSRKVEELSSLSPDKAKSRQLARYDSDTVLLDPKNYGENEDDKLGDKVYDRVLALARMLSHLDFEEFRTLKCKGWYEGASKDQFYLAYEPPAGAQPMKQPRTLYDLVYSNFKPSVTARIKFAFQIAKALHGVHSNGWLHKGIRSEHIFFFPTHKGAPRTLENSRVAGFDFARQEEPSEYSEKPMHSHHVIRLSTVHTDT